MVKFEIKNVTAMTEKDISSIRQMITDITAANTATITGELRLIKQELGFVKEQTTKTNGRVTRHDEEIKNISKAEDLHVLNCPHNVVISNFTAIYRFWKPIAITGIVVAGISITGAFVTASNFIELFKNDKVIEQQAQKEAKENNIEAKEIKADISENKKTINELGTESAFQNSKNENQDGLSGN